MIKRILQFFNKRQSVPATTLSSRTMFPKLFGNISTSGMSVTEESALSLSPLGRALTILGETVATLPFEVYEQEKNGDTRKAIEHPLYYLVRDEPSQLYTSFAFREALIIHLVLRGAAYAIIERDEDARPIALHLKHPDQVMILESQDKRRLYYEIEGIRYQAADVIHVVGTSKDGILGLDKLKQYKDSVGVSLATRSFVSKFFKNGAHLNGVLETERILDDESYYRMKRSWNDTYSGTTNAGATAILEQGTKYKPISTSPRDALLGDIIRINIEDVSRITGVPVHLLSSLDRATFNNIEHMTLQFVKFTIAPLCKRIEQEFNRKLFRKDERSRFYVRFNLEGLLRGDLQSRADYYQKMFNFGAMSPNDIREKENMNKIEGGQEYFVPLNMSILKDAGDPKKPKNTTDE